jgi:hypothetical protein
MSEPETASAAAVAGLASEVEALRRVVDPLPGRIEDLARLIAALAAQLRDLAATPAPRAMPSWLVAPAELGAAQRLLAELEAWVDLVFLRYRDAGVVLPECWLWHPDVVEELLWLMQAWLAAYQGEKASIALVGDWHDRQRPGVVRRIKSYAGACSLEVHRPRHDEHRPHQQVRNPDAGDLIARWWTTARDAPPPEPTAEHFSAPPRRPR